MIEKRLEFEKRLSELINIYSVDNDLNIPDYILARYMVKTMVLLTLAVGDVDHHGGKPKGIYD